jgi:hypothetical protein
MFFITDKFPHFTGGAFRFSPVSFLRNSISFRLIKRQEPHKHKIPSLVLLGFATQWKLLQVRFHLSDEAHAPCSTRGQGERVQV